MSGVSYKFITLFQAQGPYEAVPLIRPIVLCGPSLRNFDVTDLMHKALFHALKRQFGEKLEVVHIEEKWLKPFHNALANKSLVGTTGTWFILYRIQTKD